MSGEPETIENITMSDPKQTNEDQLGDGSELLSTELLACPFCGGDATYEEVDHEGKAWWSVGCRDENCYGWQSMKCWARKTDAAKGWNRRA